MTRELTLLSALLDEIRTSDAIVIVGAGASFMAGMPLAGQLFPLVWHTLDVHPEVKRSVCEVLGVPHGHAKDVIGLDWSRIEVAFAQIAVVPEARKTFQVSFAQLDRDRATVPSPVHTALARLLHCGRVLHVISLNWDTLLESNFRRQYGIDANAQGTKLWKPHGDCLRPEDNWVLLHEPGSIPDNLVEQMTALASERPRTLLIVGYSERDKVVVERLIRPLAERWRVFRISPRATGEGAISLPAQEALEFLVEGLNPGPEFPGWEYVTFAHQRGIEAAVSGERLGPGDVDICPHLPHFDSAARNLELLHTVEIAGSSGCGKSITAWQLARGYHRRGWEVLRPDPTRLSPDHSFGPAVRQGPWRRVLVIDDTQIFPAGFADQLAGLVGPDLKVIRATTDALGERSSPIRIPAKVAVETLATEFRRRRAELLPIVRRYDSQIGDGYSQQSLERRIEEAAKEDTPWQFAFSLRGGWRRASEELNVLRDFDRSDLLLLVVAVRQVLTVDAGCTVAEVVEGARLLGRDEAWVNAGLDRLRQRKAILAGTRIRCPHIRFATVVIQRFFEDRKDTEFPTVLSLLRETIVERRAPLQGISWLLRELYLTNAFWGGNPQWDVLTPEHIEHLVRRCCGVTTPIERRDAGYVLSALLGHRSLRPEELVPYFNVLKQWIETADGTSGHGIACLVNDLYNAAKPLARQLVESVEPRTVTAQLAKARCAEGYVWGYFLGRLSAAAGGRQRSMWEESFRDALPRERLLVMAAEFETTELGQLGELICGIAYYDFEFATECVRRALPTLEHGFAEDPLDALLETREFRWFLLGECPFGRQRRTREQRELSKQITGSIRPDRVASRIVNCRYGDWEKYCELLYWVRAVNPAKHRDIVNAIDWQRLESLAAAHWRRPCREFRLLLSSLRVDGRGKPVREWIAQHADQIDEIDPIIAGVSPEAAVAVVQRGGRFNLGGHNSSDWRLQAWAVARVAEVDKDIAISSIQADQSRIVGRLAKLEEIDCEEFPVFLRGIEKLAPELLVQLLQGIDFRTASDNWPKSLQGNLKEARRGAREVFRIVRDHCEGDIKALAERLLGLPTRKRTSMINGQKAGKRDIPGS